MTKNLISDVTSRILYNGVQALQDKGYYTSFNYDMVFTAFTTDYHDCDIRVYLEDVPRTIVINGYVFNDVETVVKRVVICNGSVHPIVDVSGEYALAAFNHFVNVMTA